MGITAGVIKGHLVSQKKRKHQERAGPEPEPQAEVPPGPEYLRRTLLGLVTALAVARPLVLGEDPGMLQARTGTSFLVLTLFWFIAALGWAVWRYWSGNNQWHGGIVEAALLVVSLAVTASTRVAPYKHPALLVATEWFALVVALFLIRQLATAESDRRHLLAAFLASAVAVSAYAVFHYNVDPHGLQSRVEQEPSPLVLSQRQIVGLLGNATRGPLPVVPLLHRISLEQQPVVEQPPEPAHASRPFAQPGSLAGYLLLFVPAMLLAVHLRYRQPQAGLYPTAAAFCCLIVMLALFLTHSREALLALALAGLAVLVVAAVRRAIPIKVALVLAAAAGTTVLALRLGWLDGLLGKSGEMASNRLDQWAATWEMIREKPWLGVGAGNFGREYPPHARPGAYESLSEPHNFVLEVWASYGMFALLALLGAFGWFFSLVLRRASRGRQPPENAPAGAGAPGSPEATRWEFYIGGVAGLLLSFLLQQTGHSPEQVVRGQTPTEASLQLDGLLAVFLAIIWFASFALFAGVRWTDRTMAAALSAGVLALLLNLCVSGGISFPSVATPLWLVVGLVLAALNLQPWAHRGDSWVLSALPLPLALGFFIAYVTALFDPVISGMGRAGASVRAAQHLEEDRDSKRPTIRDGRKYTLDKIVQPLVDAVKEDPGNARWHVQLSHWYGQLFQAFWRDGRLGQVYGRAAVEAAAEAQRLDPHGSEGYRALFELRLHFADREQKPEGRQRQYLLATRPLTQMVLLDPTDPWVRFWLARTLFDAGKPKEAVEAAAGALDLDEQQTSPRRRLGEWQHLLLRQWLPPP